MNNFTKRTISSAVFLAVMLTALLTNQYVYGAVMLFILVVMMWEFLKMTCGTEYRYSQILSIIAGATMFIMSYLYKGFGMPGRFIVLSLIPLFILMINSLYVKDKTRFAKFACLYTSILYIAIPWTMLNYTVFSNGGNYSGINLLCFFAIVWGSDVGAYIFGVTLGQKYGKKLFPSISPKKSWIGFWGGLFCTIAVCLALYFTGVCAYVGLEKMTWYHAILLAIVIDVAGVYGDLFESQWKRYYAVKDSGTAIPGHGGFLDRLDSTLFAVPAGVIYLTIFNLF